jgi:hypothetical protein
MVLSEDAFVAQALKVPNKQQGQISTGQACFHMHRL